MVGSSPQRNSTSIVPTSVSNENLLSLITQLKTRFLNKFRISTLVESTRSMLQVVHFLNSFWAEAIATACYLCNLSYTKALNNMTLYQLWTGLHPNLSHLKVFGCLAYTHIPAEKRKKTDLKGFKCTFIGYGKSNGVNGYRLYDPKSCRLFLVAMSSSLKMTCSALVL